MRLLLFFLQVQLRHRPCGPTVSCVCGVAARENDIILVADMCADSRLHFLKYNHKLHEGARIKRDDNGRVFEASRIEQLQWKYLRVCSREEVTSIISCNIM